mmetsp:Transcript_16233/g.16966  ORF Transcript_16233/g.16966 Transcript_16233/m.16966 type:complete len:299 (-) Transcript_16233:208-1104(-)
MSIQRRGDHFQRASIADYISPDNGLRGKMERNGQKPKNHMKDNYNQLKTIQDKNRERREEENNNNGKELYKLSQFRDVGARVFEPVQSRNLSDKHEGIFLVRGASERRREELAEEGKQRRREIENSLNEAKMYSNHQPSSPRKRSIPRADDIPIQPSRPPQNFINRNKQEIVKRQSSSANDRNSEDDDQIARHESYGRVPDYLVNRKQQWQELEEEKIRNRPDPNCPKGMMLMPEDERQSTLQTLHESRNECLKQIERLPFVIETPSAKRRAEELENKLREIEKAIDIFSKPKVFVAK